MHHPGAGPSRCRPPCRRPTIQAGDVLQQQERDAAQVAQLDEVRRLERRLRKQHAVVGDEPDQESVESREAGHERRGVSLLEFIKARRIHDAGDHFPHVARMTRVGVHDAAQLFRVGFGGSTTVMSRGSCLEVCSVETMVRASRSACSSSSAK